MSVTNILWPVGWMDDWARWRKLWLHLRREHWLPVRAWLLLHFCVSSRHCAALSGEWHSQSTTGATALWSQRRPHPPPGKTNTARHFKHEAFRPWQPYETSTPVIRPERWSNLTNIISLHKLRATWRRENKQTPPKKNNKKNNTQMAWTAGQMCFDTLSLNSKNVAWTINACQILRWPRINTSGKPRRCSSHQLEHYGPNKSESRAPGHQKKEENDLNRFWCCCASFRFTLVFAHFLQQHTLPRS